MSNFDTTSIISATTAGVRLVGAVLDVAPRVKHAIDGVQHSSGGAGFQGVARGPGDNDVTGMSTTAPMPATAAQIQSLALQRVDPEKETRAYETVNYVLKTIGTRILEANMVNMGALATALTAATAHIEVKLFSGETNRLFQSLARKLNDVNLVNSVFTSIYLVGFLTAELTSSLPNYKREYPALGPLMVQQMMRVAIGDDAFRENQTANLNAYQTVATTAGLLKPTDIGYSIFPDFPSFSPTRYSSKSMLERSSNKSILEKLVKHLEMYGFPQPLQGRDVGPIRDWRFLSSDSNSRTFEVDKADKLIGSQFGRVLYWLICSAHRMPSGMAVVAYYDQHIALIRYLGPRFGYRVLNTGGDLNMSGPHLQLNKKQRATFDNWVVIMPSESLLAERRAAMQQQAQQQAQQAQQIQMAAEMASRQRPAAPSPAGSSSQRQTINEAAVSAGLNANLGTTPQRRSSGMMPPSPGSGAGRLSIGSELSSPENRASGNPATLAMRPASDTHSEDRMNPPPHNVVLWHLNNLDSIYKSALVPRCNQLISNPPTDPEELKREFTKLVEELHAGILPKVEAIDVNGDESAGLKKKLLADHVRMTIGKLDAVYREASTATSPPSRPSSVASVPSVRPAATGEQTLFQVISGASELDGTSSPNTPFSQSHQVAQELPGTTEPVTAIQHPIASPAAISPALIDPPIAQRPSPIGAASGPSPTPPNASPSPSTAPGLTSRPSVVRRKAPPPPKRVTLAKALYDFEPDEEEGSTTELAFAEGDIIEIVEKSKALEEDGWCRARVQGQKKIGLAPLDYLEELPNQPSVPPSRISRISSASTAVAIPEQAEPNPTSAAEFKVSPIIQSSPLAPNAASSTIPSPSKAEMNQASHVGQLDATQEVEQPPPSYASAISQPAVFDTATTITQSPAETIVSARPPSGPPPSQHGQSVYANIPSEKPSGHQTLPLEQPINPPNALMQSSMLPAQSSTSPSSDTPSQPDKPGQSSSIHQSSIPQVYPPQNPYVQQQIFTGNSYASPMMNYGRPGGSTNDNIHAYASMAEAASGVAQAGAHVYATMHNSNNGSLNNNQTTGGTTLGDSYNTINLYGNLPNSNPNSSSSVQATPGDTVGAAANNTANNNTNESSSSPGGNTNINIDNQYNLTSNTQTIQNQNYDGFNGAFPTYYPPGTSPSALPSGIGSETSNVPADTNSTTNAPAWEYSAPYFPPASSAPTDPSTTSTTQAQNPIYDIPTSLPGSGAATSSNIYATASPTDSSQYVPDMNSNNGFSTSSLPTSTTPNFDLCSPTFGQDSSGNAGMTSPFASLGSSSSPNPTHTAGLDSTTATSTSPFAGLALNGLSNTYTDSGSAYAQIDTTQAVSPLAGLALSDSSGSASTQGVTAGVTSPLASLAVADSTTSGGGYFDSTATVTLTTDTTSSDTISPLAGLANTAGMGATSMTSTTNLQYNDSSTIPIDNTFGFSNATTTLGFSSSDNNGNWNLTDYTTADSSSFDYSGSFDF